MGRSNSQSQENPARTILNRFRELCDAHRLTGQDRIDACNRLLPPSGKSKGATKDPGAKMLLMNAIKVIQEDTILPYVEVEVTEVEGQDPVRTFKVDGETWTPYQGVKVSKDASVSTEDLLASLADARSKFAVAQSMGSESASARQQDRIDAVTAELVSRGVEVPPAE